MRRGFRHDWRNRLDDRRGLDRACRPLSPRRGLRQRGGDNLLDHPERNVIEADEGARRLDLGVNHGIAAASIVEDAAVGGSWQGNCGMLPATWESSPDVSEA